MRIFESKPGAQMVHHTPNTKFDFIDRAAAGEIEAAALLAEGYLKGIYECEKNEEKALKWARYAAKHGSELGQTVVEMIVKTE
jgi:TPR repeat protein